MQEPVSQNRAPAPVGIPIPDIVKMAQGGEIKLPMFQRGFVWNHEKIRNLLDSIYHGYPVGMLLFWETFKRLPEDRRLVDFTLPETPSTRPTNYVLDGQQRLVTILCSLTTIVEEQTDKFPVYFDLRAGEFTHDGGAEFPHRLPMSIVISDDLDDYFKAVESIRGLPDGHALERIAQEVMRRFQGYQVPVLILRNAEPASVAPVFERINSSATRLTLFDFMVAVLWREDFNFKKHVADIRDSLEPKRFDDVDEETVIRTLSAIVLRSAKRETMMEQLRTRSRDQLADDILVTQQSLERAVDFLSTDLRVVGDELLPYERQLVLLAYVFSQVQHPNNHQTAVLRKWFWRTSFAERYRRGGEGLFDNDLLAVQGALDEPDVLERFGTPPATGDLISTSFRVASALSKSFVALLAVKAPFNLRTGRPIDVEHALSPYNRRQFHHIFPKKFLKEAYPDHPHVDSLANICMLGAEDNRAIGSRAPSDYMAELQEKHGNRFIEILQSNRVPESAIPLLMSDDFDAFLQERTDHLQHEIAGLCY